ncbi:FecR family protein [Pedobacter xixiisoli]|uniref:FecR family protein n=1 Tax=Pedobacter xixiisoli TaxID=1476464 RepID=A0A286A6M3_9SPHI|nr:FecR family protein [Pedobacter xixiisoli]SOD17564.1 FecR family protein [Pedobacter xixiisoli]
MKFNRYQAEDFAAEESFIAYYLQTNEQAIAFWENWISLNPEKLDEIYKAELLLGKLHLHLNETELNDAFGKFDNFLDDHHGTAALEPVKSTKLFSYAKLAIAASLLIFSLLGIYLLNQKSAPQEYISYHNDYGKTAIITLEDGSKISLNSNSTLKYPQHFANDKREVELEGEGFFEISKDIDRPFTVKTNRLNTTVLGTKFNVSAYRNSAAVSIALVEGSVTVELSDKSQKITLKPTEMASVNASSKQLEKSTFDANKTTAWQTGAIIFENASFEDIAAKLYNAYGIKLINKTSDKRWKYSGNFTKTDYISIIQNICFAKRINYKINNNIITLVP